MKHEDRPSVSKSHSFGGYGPPLHGPPLNRGDSVNSSRSTGSRFFTKQDSLGTSWRLSPSSSGYVCCGEDARPVHCNVPSQISVSINCRYKTQSQSIRSESVTPSPTGYGSGGDHTPEPSSTGQSPPETSCGVVWAVTDMANVPTGSVLIDPQTLQPFTNQDGYTDRRSFIFLFIMFHHLCHFRSIYHYDPSNLPANQDQTTFAPFVKKPMSRKKLEKQKSIRDGHQHSRAVEIMVTENPAKDSAQINDNVGADDNAPMIENHIQGNAYTT